jgi:hypothetical protein
MYDLKESLGNLIYLIDSFFIIIQGRIMVEYKEIKRRNGTSIVFCNLEELLMDFYKVKSMEEVEQFLQGNEYIIHCPFCKAEGHTKHKLYINRDLTIGGHCFVCGRAFIHVTNEIKFNYVLPNKIMNFGFARPPLRVIPLTDPNWSIDKFTYEFDDFDQAGYEYLMSRHKYMDPLYKALDFKFWDGNPVIPFKYHGNVFYYQIRFSGVLHGDKTKIRYFMPPITDPSGKVGSAKPPYIIDHANTEGKPCKGIIVCEGIFDAISLLVQAPDYIPIAVLGSSITDYQIDFIREYAGQIEKILVYMDETDISKRIADKLKSEIDYCPIYIISSNGEDPEEHMIRLMNLNPGSEINCIKSDYVPNNCRSKYKQINFIY